MTLYQAFKWTMIIVVFVVGTQVGNWQGRKLQKTEDVVVCAELLTKKLIEHRKMWWKELGVEEVYDDLGINCGEEGER